MQYFTEIDPFERLPFGYRCRRCGNQASHLFAQMSCAVCQGKHPYCRSCIEMGRVSTCEALYIWTGPAPNWPPVLEACKWKGQLTKAQQHASKQLVKAVREKKELLIWAVCGSGKTEMVFEGIGHALEQGLRVCLATPRVDVVRELLPRFRAAFPTIPISALYGGSTDQTSASPFVLATTHQLLRYARAFDVLVIDEIDSFPFHKSKTLPYAAKRAAKQSSTTIYLTATPRKSLKRKLERNVLDVVFVPNRFHGHPLPVPSMVMCWDLRKTLEKLPKAFRRWIRTRENRDRQLLIFVSTIRLAEDVKAKLEEVGRSKQNVAAVYSTDPERESKVQKFRNRELTVLVTTTILERGVTFPSVDVAVLDAGHDVFDEEALVQIAGRAGRSSKDPDGEVIFFHNGRTEAMVKAISSIRKMNKRGGFS
ncbi:DEAD/DEAH box helicase [Radiobacillus deserti]|uniref:DEAD/DEAH box helicase n=2 Tax=Radiobacillus deserti TaxID=2594883 RepID=A0A516KLE5_9BACI|nr:DEAD/DEAH box helicase [Radiobacillus deserti]